MAKTKLTPLPRVKGQPREKSAALRCWGYQLRELKRRAAEAGVSTSRYLNELLWRDWIDLPTRRAVDRGRDAA